MQNTISQRGQRYQFDALVIGSGIAGLSYILELVRLHPHIQVALLAKSALNQSNSYYAQGGIAAAMPADIQQHIADTLTAGDGLCNQQAVQAILEEGPSSIDYLNEQGVFFDCDTENNLLRGIEAGHAVRRIYRVGDHTGAAIIDALLKQVKQLPQVTLFEHHAAINLITQVEPHRPSHFPEVIGAYVLAEPLGLIHTFLAKVIVLATGGAGKVYRYTSNPHVATGDGIAMAYRAGARVGGLEFYQFHPTLFYHPKINNFLISEALRGEGAYLRLPETGERFMQRYAPKAMELATRDVVARAVFSEIEQSNYAYVHLDIRHLDKRFLEHRFPMIYRTLLEVGLDLSRDMIPVVPAAHYMGGGVLTNVVGKTDLKRLFAIGETAFSGLHGANRLASNSLLEGIVMGRYAARSSAEALANPLQLQRSIGDWDSASVVDLRRASQINVHWRGLRGEMSSYAGIIRTEAGLRDQLKLVLARRDMIEEYYWKYAITRDLIELRNIILIAELIVRSALNRRESRGGHYREDFKNRFSIAQESIVRANDFSRIETV
ncbi:MAG: nadB [Gammaproteobacteria bacterium]|nr:nadB [Gammaproteobacteria bacterium]